MLNKHAKKEDVKRVVFWLKNCGISLAEISRQSGICSCTLSKLRSEEKTGLYKSSIEKLKPVMAMYPVEGVRIEKPIERKPIGKLLEKRREYIGFTERSFSMKLDISEGEYQIWLKYGVPADKAEEVYERWSLREFEEEQ